MKNRVMMAKSIIGLYGNNKFMAPESIEQKNQAMQMGVTNPLQKSKTFRQQSAHPNQMTNQLGAAS